MPFKRLPAGRVSEINENFAKISQTLRLAEKEARKAIAMQSKAQRLMMLREKEEKELELRALLGKRARSEVMYDTCLFNQEIGMDSGFATDDQYNVYDKGFFTAQNTLSTLYRPKKDAESDTYDSADEQLDKIVKTDGFKPDKSFTGTSEKTGPRDRPVEFEKEADPFGLDPFLTEVKKHMKALEKVGAVVQ